MKKFFLIAALTTLLAAPCFSDSAVPAKDFRWPAVSCPVRFGAVEIECVWTDGRPMASRHDLAKFLHIPDEGPDPTDLIEAMTEKGWKVRVAHDGSIECINPVSAMDRPVTVRESPESLRALANFHQMVRNKGLSIESGPRAILVNRIGQDIARVARRPIPWNFFVVRSNEPNAACFGEGVVYVTSALLDIRLTEDEIAGTLAHEVAHGARQHIEEDRNEKRRIGRTVSEIDHIDQVYEDARRRANQQYSSDVQSGMDPSAADNNRRSSLEVASREHARSLHYMEDAVKGHLSYAKFAPQSSERQADMAGIRYAQEAGYGPAGLLHALEKLRLASYARYGVSALLGGETHPPIGERIDALHKILGQ